MKDKDYYEMVLSYSSRFMSSDALLVETERRLKELKADLCFKCEDRPSKWQLVDNSGPSNAEAKTLELCDECWETI